MLTMLTEGTSLEHPTLSMNASHFTNLFTNLCDHISTNGKAPLHSHINLQHSTIPLLALMNV